MSNARVIVQAVLIGGCVRRLISRCEFRLSDEDINETAAPLCRKIVH